MSDHPAPRSGTGALINDGQGTFRFGKFSNPRVFPAVGGHGLGLDAIYDGGHFYVLRTIDQPPGFYQGTVLQKVRYPELAPSSVICTYAGRYRNGSSWINWIGFSGGDVVSFDADYALRVPE